MIKTILIGAGLTVLMTGVVLSQNSDSAISDQKRNTTFTYFYAVETSFISPREAGFVKMLYGEGDTEQNFFKTHTVHFKYKLTEKYNLGIGLKYGNNFYRYSSRRRNELNNNDRDYDSYLGIGVSGSIQLFKFGAKEKRYPLRVTNVFSLQYVRFDGIEVEKNFNLRAQKEISLKGVFAESGVMISYLFSDEETDFRVIYQPISFQFATYGYAFQYNGIGISISF